MASKKYTLLLGILSLFCIASFAQRNDAMTYWGDSSKIATKNMPQFNEFMNNQYPYPARPRDMWEASIFGGPSFILGDISPRLNIGGGVSLRKSLSHTLSIRAGYIGSLNKGQDYKLRMDQGAGVWSGYTSGYTPNHYTRIHQGTLDLVISLNTMSHYRGNPKTNWYVFGGYAAFAADADVDAKDANGNLYTHFVPGNYVGKRGDILNRMKDNQDKKYESNAPTAYGNRRNAGRYKDNWLIRHGASVGAGVARKMNDRFNIALEQRFSFTFDDEFDGFNAGRSNDILSLTAVRINYNFGNSAKRIQPLWWINPNNYLYNELNSPRHMKLPTPVLPDADGDGVTDQFDLEPNTPAGAAVDARGVARDTDGDGVPDHKDKELLTPANCHPINADGVGTCPEPACCKELKDKLESGQYGGPGGRGGDCGIGNLPTIQFKSGSATLNTASKNMLNSVAERVKAMPQCNIRVIGYGAANKRAQQLSHDRVNAVIRYLVEQQGISESRFIFEYGQQGADNTVDLQGTTETGPNTVPAPHPNLRTRQ